MTDEQRKVSLQSAHRLRNRLTFIMLCSDTLKLELRGVLSRQHEQEFQEMDRVIEETKALLNTLLRQFDLEPRVSATSNGACSQLIGGPVEPDSAARAAGPGAA